MTKWKQRWIAGVGGAAWIVAVTVFPSVIEACHGHMMHGQMQSGHDQHDQDESGDPSAQYLKHLLKHAKEIGLTQEQINKLKTLRLDFKRTEARLEADSKIATLELHAMLEDEQADLNTIQTRVDQLKKTEGALLVEAIKSKRSAIALLTPDQREKERAQHEHMKSGAQHGGGMGGMMGGMMGSMGSGSHGQSGGDHGSGGAGGSQQHQH